MLPRPANVRRLSEAIQHQNDTWWDELRKLSSPARLAMASRVAKAGMVAVARANQAWDEAQYSKALQNQATARLLERFARDLCDL